MTAYYNEIDPFAAQWLRELIKGGHIADGVVDERSIEDVIPNDIAEFTQCHFFAGIGVWSYALRQAGWPDDRPVWTGSCPCQPFSSAGKGAGFADERHLWPAFHWLINQCRPECVLGEQVAGKDGLTWLDLVSTDLEGSGYTCGSAVTAACGFGAPHQRKRLYWVGSIMEKPNEGRTGNHGGQAGQCRRNHLERESESIRQGYGQTCTDGSEPASSTGSMADTQSQRSGEGQQDTRRCAAGSAARQGAECFRGGATGSMADTDSGRTGRGEHTPRWYKVNEGGNCGSVSELANADDTGPQGRGSGRNGTHKRATGADSVGGERCGPTNGFWRDADWLGCRDGKWRPVKPGSFPLVARATSSVVPGCNLGTQDCESTSEARVMRLRGYGNAVCSEQCQAFIKAAMEAL